MLKKEAKFVVLLEVKSRVKVKNRKLKDLKQESQECNLIFLFDKVSLTDLQVRKVLEFHSKSGM
jgi:hypothetical protein